jgi:hypothetical protein
MLAQQFVHASAREARRTAPSLSCGIPFTARESRLTKQLKAMNAAQIEFWRHDAERVERILKMVAAGIQARSKANQRAAAKKPRPLRSKKNADRDARIRKASAEGKTPKEIGGAENLSAAQVRKILKPKTKTRV